MRCLELIGWIEQHQQQQILVRGISGVFRRVLQGDSIAGLTVLRAIRVT